MARARYLLNQRAENDIDKRQIRLETLDMRRGRALQRQRTGLLEKGTDAPEGNSKG